MRIVNLTVGVALVAVLVVLTGFMSLRPLTPPAATNARTVLQPGTVSASDAFLAFLLPTIPPTVTNLQGEAETFQGYGAYLRFQTDDATIDAIIATGYQPTAGLWQQLNINLVNIHLVTPPSFSPPWSPQSIHNPEFYKMDVVNSATHSGRHHLIVDRNSGLVYFIGLGS